MCRHQIRDFPVSATETEPTLQFDPEWLGITRAMHGYMPTVKLLDRQPQSLLPPGDDLTQKVQDDISWVKGYINTDAPISSIQEFQMTSPGPIENFEGTTYPQRTLLPIFG